MNFKLIIAVISPILAFMLWIYLKDKYDKEPILNLLKYFIVGLIISFIALNIEMILINLNIYSGYVSVMYNSFIVAGFTEEIIKFLFLMILINKDNNYSEKLDGVMYSIFISLGFSTIENILYVLNEPYMTYEISIVRSIISVPGHIIFAVLMGYYISEYKFSSNIYKKRENLILAIVVPIIVHGIFDFLLMMESKVYIYIFIVYLVVLIKIGLDILDKYILNSRRNTKKINRRR